MRRLHIDVANLARITSGDPGSKQAIADVLGMALLVGKDTADTLLLLVAAIDDLARMADDPVAVLGIAYTFLGESLSAVSLDLRRELARPADSIPVPLSLDQFDGDDTLDIDLEDS